MTQLRLLLISMETLSGSWLLHFVQRGYTNRIYEECTKQTSKSSSIGPFPMICFSQQAYHVLLKPVPETSPATLCQVTSGFKGKAMCDFEILRVYVYNYININTYTYIVYWLAIPLKNTSQIG